MAGAFTANDVLRFMDRCLMENQIWFFIDLEHPYVYTANSRLTLYADDAHWAIVAEVSGYNPRAACFLLTLTYFSDALRDLKPGGSKNQFTWNAEFVTLIEQMPMYEAVQHFAVSETPVALKVRDSNVLVPAARRTFIPNVGSRPWPKDARAEDIGRYVAYEYADLCRATDAEKRMHLPEALPELMTIDQWHHRRWHYSHAPNSPGPRASGDAPSSYETYRLIAEVLATRDPSRYRPTLPPNSHWSHWPQAGAL
jgi:hypothetical protein